jgi:hypothetical protein
MDWKKLIRDADKLRAATSVQADGSVVAIKPVKIYIPKRYEEKQLAFIGSETYILGVYAITLDDRYYAVSRVNAMMRISPTSINTVKIDQDTYLEFVFDAGSVVVATTELRVSDTLVYQIFDEFVSKGNVPWFIGYDDRARLFETADKHAGVYLGENHAILGMATAATTRVRDDRAKFLRHALNTPEDLKKVEGVNIALRSVTYGATNTTAKLVGAYWNDGLNAALVNPAERTEKVEELLRR